MIPRELIAKIRRIEIRTGRLVNDFFGGEYHSVFKGQGMEFDEVREYQPGDEVRLIDWNVTARAGTPFIKKFREERELTVMIMYDASGSGRFGSRVRTKSDMAAEIAAVLAFSAIKNNDKVGLIVFTDRVELFVPPRKGRGHVLRIIRDILYFEPTGVGTDLPGAFEFLAGVLRRKAVVFVISDFFAAGYQRPMAAAHRFHDLTAICVSDPREQNLPDVGLIEMEDLESGQRLSLDTGSARVRRRYAEFSGRRTEARDRYFRANKLDAVTVSTDCSYVEPLVRFFKMRERRLR